MIHKGVTGAKETSPLTFGIFCSTSKASPKGASTETENLRDEHYQENP
jgi:hypothetical protein